MNLKNYVALLRSSVLWLLVGALLGAALGFTLAKILPKTYSAGVEFYVSTPVEKGSTAQTASQFGQSRVATYAELLTSGQFGSRVAKTADVGLTANQVTSRIRSQASIDTVIVSATVLDSDEDRALKIAEGIESEFGPYIDQLDNAGVKEKVVLINTVSPPKLANDPVAPDTGSYVLGGAVLGALLALGIVMLRNRLDSSVRDSEGASRLAGAPVIGEIPWTKDNDQGQLVISPNSSSPRAEAHRKLRTNLNFIDAGRSAPVLAVTSAVDSEGKTTLAINTALSFADLGERVCLVGADLRRRGVTETLGLPTGRPGLSEYLAGQSTVERALQHWNEGKIDVIGSGQLPPNPAELLASGRLDTLFDALRGAYDRVIVDAAPLLPVTDGEVVSAAADGTLLVVRPGSTTRTEVAQSAQSLRTVNAQLVGVVLNTTKTSVDAGPYGG